MKPIHNTIDSPVGPLKITADDKCLISIEFTEGKPDEGLHHHIIEETSSQLLEYFKGERKSFNLPLRLEGTPFQKEVWASLQEIPYGKTASYQEVAEKIQRPKAVRALGQANKANRFPIVIPCHRVIGKNKQLTGYAGKQVDKKSILLELEKEFSH
ncbi:methylated-DNA--[protein]-cysteine S-methyltransferase [Rossellomorea marisflavi]|uniref:methylated-DNA--[protein]-cysteine S-methyltransferase n=1 Tax=Rossellomorea marisflavi TaxID=189381 RepID=UPI0035172B9D